MGRMRAESSAACNALQKLHAEREADRAQLLETQTALAEALEHLEESSAQAQVRAACLWMWQAAAEKRHALGAVAAAACMRFTLGTKALVRCMVDHHDTWEKRLSICLIDGLFGATERAEGTMR